MDQDEKPDKIMRSATWLVALAAALIFMMWYIDLYRVGLGRQLAVFVLPVGMGVLFALFLEALHGAVAFKIKHNFRWWYILSPLGLVVAPSIMNFVKADKYHIVYFAVFYMAAFCLAWESRYFDATDET